MIKLIDILEELDSISEKVTFTKKYNDNPKLKGGQKRLPDELQAKIVKEGDHEVYMAQNSLKAIAKAAVELSQKIGNMERNIPGWIQDHITNAENYIEQAAQGFHELDDEDINEMKINIPRDPNATYVSGKKVDLRSIDIDGIDMGDYPDFVDAYIASAQFEDGTDLEDYELEKLQDQVDMNELVHNRLF